jgi:hypothetical protein
VGVRRQATAEIPSVPQQVVGDVPFEVVAGAFPWACWARCCWARWARLWYAGLWVMGASSISLRHLVFPLEETMTLFYVVSSTFMALCRLALIKGRLVQGPEKSAHSIDFSGKVVSHS